jgi:hypothetical protein
VIPGLDRKNYWKSALLTVMLDLIRWLIGRWRFIRLRFSQSSLKNWAKATVGNDKGARIILLVAGNKVFICMAFRELAEREPPSRLGSHVLASAPGFRARKAIIVDTLFSGDK